VAVGMQGRQELQKGSRVLDAGCRKVRVLCLLGAFRPTSSCVAPTHSHPRSHPDAAPPPPCRSQWGNTATHYKAVYNIQKPKNCANFVKQNPALVKDLKSCIGSFGQSGSTYKVKFNDLCDVISKVCTVSNYGVKTVGFPQRTMVISVADQNKCDQSGVNSCKSYHRALCINGKVHDGYISTKQH
jgi:hypothetical protein